MAKHTNLNSKKWCCVSDCYNSAHKKILVLKFRDGRNVYLYLCLEHIDLIEDDRFSLFANSLQS